jgi:hypothetical protein
MNPLVVGLIIGVSITAMGFLISAIAIPRLLIADRDRSISKGQYVSREAYDDLVKISNDLAKVSKDGNEIVKDTMELCKLQTKLITMRRTEVTLYRDALTKARDALMYLPERDTLPRSVLDAVENIARVIDEAMNDAKEKMSPEIIDLANEAASVLARTFATLTPEQAEVLMDEVMKEAQSDVNAQPNHTL